MGRFLVLGVILLNLFVSPLISIAQSPGNDPNRIVGKWISEEKNLIVEIYRCKAEYKAKVVWFTDKDDLTMPMDLRTDSRNPNPALRSRKLLGMEVLRQLKFDQKSDSWDTGIIYDSMSGREWSSCVSLTKGGRLRVKGYWKFKFVCKSMDFLSYKTTLANL